MRPFPSLFGIPFCYVLKEPIGVSTPDGDCTLVLASSQEPKYGRLGSGLVIRRRRRSYPENHTKSAMDRFAETCANFNQLAKRHSRRDEC